ncbi:MAG: spore cortex biosynthesis protein YabQ [Clostridia bacterium]|nr:spore cortex biosynthesis protein YabQ [Clostridia bacterium]
MDLSNAQQLSVLLWSLLFGICLGAVYDLLRAFRVFVQSPAVAVLFQDLFYFLTAALASFLFIFEVNDGTVRLFILLAFLVGGLAERCTIGQIFLRLCHRIKSFFIRRKQARRKEHTQETTSRHTRLSKAGKNRCIRE